MKKMLCSLLLGCSCLGLVNAQTTSKDSTLQISGSGDIYYRYDFAASKTYVPTSPDAVGNKQNAVDFGMLDLKIKKSLGKASFFTDLAFGSRASSNIDNNGSAPLSYYVQNLYFSYQIQKKLSVTGGIMYRYDTYEKLTSVDNFNYLSSNAFIESRKVPTRSVGIKANYTFSDMVSASLGLFNSINASALTDAVSSTPNYGLSDVVAEVFVNPAKGLKLSAAIWKEGQSNKGTHENFQVHYHVAKGLKLGLDFNNYTGIDSTTQAANGFNNFTSEGIYAQKSLTSIFTLGLRFEHEQTTQSSSINTQNTVTGSYLQEKYNILTLTGREKVGALSFKQEIKYDMTDKGNIYTPYTDKNGVPNNKDFQIVLAAIFSL